MSLGDQFQTIVYYSDTGDIRAILPNQYVKSRKSLNGVLNIPESVGLKFFYLQGMYKLDKKEWRVKLGEKGKAPALESITGEIATLAIAKAEARYILGNYKEAIFEFEGGFGDYIDEADVIISCRKLYPQKKITVVMVESRINAMKAMEGFKDINIVTNTGQVRNRGPRIAFAGINAMCGEYRPGGKVGIYSAISGMEEGAPRARFILSRDERTYGRNLIKSKIKKKEPMAIALHTMSGNTNTKSIRPDNVVKLLAPLLDNKNIYFLHLGGAGEEAVKHPQIISLQGMLKWKEVIAVMSVCDRCVCIDSAILHIAQHLELPTLSFWGPTSPGNILGEDPGVEYIETTLKCKGCNAYDCSNGQCMSKFNQKTVERKLKSLIRG
jgi:hypothetical protein